MFSFASFFGVSIFGLLSYWATTNLSFFIVAFFAAGAIILFLNAVLHYSMNDYNLFQNINDLNDKIKAHNKRVALTKEKTKQIRTDILQGKGSKDIGGGASGLA